MTVEFVVEFDNGFHASAVGHAIFTTADTMEALEVNIREAVDCHFDNGEEYNIVIKELT